MQKKSEKNIKNQRRYLNLTKIVCVYVGVKRRKCPLTNPLTKSSKSDDRVTVSFLQTRVRKALERLLFLCFLCRPPSSPWPPSFLLLLLLATVFFFVSKGLKEYLAPHPLLVLGFVCSKSRRMQKSLLPKQLSPSFQCPWQSFDHSSCSSFL